MKRIFALIAVTVIGLAFSEKSDLLVETVVPETNFRIVANGTAVVDFADVCPHACAQTHWARLARCVDFATGQIESAQNLASIANCIHFAVAGWVVVLHNTVVTFCNNFAVLDDDATKRATVATCDALLCFLNCHLHKFVHVCTSFRRKNHHGVAIFLAYSSP